MLNSYLIMFVSIILFLFNIIILLSLSYLRSEIKRLDEKIEIFYHRLEYLERKINKKT